MIKDIDILAREWADAHVAGDEELGRLLGPAVGWERVVVLGDSIAAGVREPSPGYRDLGDAAGRGAGVGTGSGDRGCGRHDMLRREFDPNMVRDELSAIVTPLRAARADILTFDLLDNTGTGLVPERFLAVLRERLAHHRGRPPANAPNRSAPPSPTPSSPRPTPP
jgi:hypothetical protein